MKRINAIYRLAFFTLFLHSCTSIEIDEVIKNYNNVDFSSLKSVSIYPRNSDALKGTSIYLVDSYLVECSPYVVEVDNKNKSIISIDNNLVMRKCGKDYFTKSKIEQILKNYYQFNLVLINVDNEGNVYINPDRAEKPLLLRKSKNSVPIDIKSYKKYRGDWYVRK